MNVPWLLMGSAAVTGLLGSTHCVAMCGGVVALTCSATPLVRRSRVRAGLPYVVAYNTGRIASYATAGGVAGALGAGLTSFGLVAQAQLGLRLVAGVLMVAVGLYVAGLGGSLRWIERAGAPIWRRVAPLARRFVPATSPSRAFALGLLWGWLPCGLVYAALAGAVTSGSAAGGALTMMAFGLGTLPMLLAMGSAATVVARAARMRPVRALAGAVLVGLGLLQLVHTGEAIAAVRDGRTPICCAGHQL
jgi:sulfite exporter TauE/SafE